MAQNSHELDERHNRIVKHGAGTIQKLNELALDVQMLVINDLTNYFF